MLLSEPASIRACEGVSPLGLCDQVGYRPAFVFVRDVEAQQPKDRRSNIEITDPANRRTGGDKRAICKYTAFGAVFGTSSGIAVFDAADQLGFDGIERTAVVP